MVWYSGFGILGSPAKPYHPFNTKWPTGSENRSDLRLLNSNQLLLNKFIDHSFYENLKNSKWPPGGPKMVDGVNKNGCMGAVVRGTPKVTEYT